ncbi:ABC transporter ATP-binding protein [Paraliomyxa miuraensis]|uniref:ABC transporter ATP-binding protein n=1 Tax=Paraliomyxa miuraensis TaxID=376150 RepID=UPI00224D18D8|nr:ABC transporter ATP-binding protein [Paraliomyxa miuraensis]MCX4243609.1 ABC transporter ATP-binding protein [Paraliomyxa miuraensis]
MSAEATKADDGHTKPRADKPTIIRCQDLGRTFWRGKERLDVLEELDLEIPEGSFEALMGPSGSGKTTLLNIIAGLDRPTRGRIEVAGKSLGDLSEAALAKWRSQTIGFVFQHFNLIPVLTAVENVELPLLLTKVPASERKKRAQTALRVVGLEDRMDHRPQQLSGGQEQRVGIARAIVHDPKIIVADEPTGELDRQSADDVLTLLERLNREFDKTILMVTHDPAAAERASVLRKLDKGRLS